jgi:glycosyltransferase involved in cell wall biosynthesis
MRRCEKSHNLLFIDSGYGYGGSAATLFSLLCALNRETFDPAVLFYFPAQGKDVENIKNLGIDVTNFGMRPERVDSCNLDDTLTRLQDSSRRIEIFRNYFITLQDLLLQYLPNAFKLATFIRRRNIRLVILNNDLHYHIPGVLAAQLAGARCICRKAGIGGGRKIKKVLGRFVDVFWAISQATALDQVQMKVPTKKLVTFYEGVDIDKFDPSQTGREIRLEFNLSEDTPVIGSIARMDIGKGQMELIQAAALVVKEFPRAVFLIVGDDLEFGGVLLKRLKQEAALLGVTESIIFTGWRTDIPNILAGIDLFVHCPTGWAEGLGIAALEAMAMGKPTIVSDNFGLKETTEDKVTGFIVPKGDTLVLSQAILILLRDRKLASDMGTRARLRAERLFDIRKNVKQAEKLFLELLG